MLDASPDCVKVLSSEGSVQFMNHRGLEMNGLASFEDIRGKEFAAMWPAEERELIRDAIRRAQAGMPARTEGFCPAADGQPRWWELHFAPLPSDGSEPGRVIAVSRDVSERHAANEALRRSEAELRNLNETLEQRVEEQIREQDRLWQLSEDLLVIADYAGRLVRVSPSWTRMTGHDDTTLRTMPYEDLIHPDDLDRVKGVLDLMRRTGQPMHYENRLATHDGTWRECGAWTLPG